MQTYVTSAVDLLEQPLDHWSVFEPESTLFDHARVEQFPRGVGGVAHWSPIGAWNRVRTRTLQLFQVVPGEMVVVS